ncbi:MAG: leucine--tRNA ligase [Acidobacteriota bacterium]
MKEQYEFQELEIKWQKRWEDEKIFKVSETPGKKEFYCLEMLPYPSGRIHMGHVRNYSIGDAMARFKMMQGYNVLHPMGWDALGMPAENAAIKHKTHPKSWTLNNIDHMRKQIKRLGFGYDWSREVTTCLPEYYRWNQWFFLKLLERGLAYRGRRAVNWCKSCQTVLANEQVEDGGCWRCGRSVTKREFNQWFLKITHYAEELLQELDHLQSWPERVITMQQNWIGRSEGSSVSFQVEGLDKKIDIFTTRIDTIFGSTFLVMAAEHPDLKVISRGLPAEQRVQEFVTQQLRKSLVDRFSEEVEKVGVFTGRYAINPFNGERIPIWVANFVLMEYGTGAVMSVPAHDQRDFDFAKKYGMEIRQVIRPESEDQIDIPMKRAFIEDGILINSGSFSGLRSDEARGKMTRYAKENGFGNFEVSYRLKDWGISRQRYWGTPIPVIYCQDCGIVPVPENELPVILPDQVVIEGYGSSPLERAPGFLNVKCPKCEKAAKRETDTMDTFIDSSWYFYRYCDPLNQNAPFSRDVADYWFPIDLYIGGIEHATMHLIYCRFFAKFMRDIGLIRYGEPVQKLFTQGMVIRFGQKMSKSKGNEVTPDEMIERYGADTTRLFSLFASPPERDLEWSDQGVEGSFRFLSRVWRLLYKFEKRLKDVNIDFSGIEAGDNALKLRRKTHQTIFKVTGDIDRRMHFNTAIAAIMELVNELYLFYEREGFSMVELMAIKESLQAISLLLVPFAPHFAEEMRESLGGKGLANGQSWPVADERLLEEESVLIVIQVNGKLRGKIVAPRGSSAEYVFTRAQEDDRIRLFLAGKSIVKKIYIPDKLFNIVVR